MKLPLLRVPSRDARDADHLAIMLVAGGVYFLWGRESWSPTLSLWMTLTSATSILAGLLLWIRVPHCKWLGFMVALSVLGLSVRHGLAHGWAASDILPIVGSLLFAYWIARIDYAHRFSDQDGWI